MNARIPNDGASAGLKWLGLAMLVWAFSGCDSPQPAGAAPLAAPEARADAEQHEEEHGEEEQDEEEAAVVRLTLAQQQAAGIRSEILGPRMLEVGVRAPGEVRLNAYATYRVTPRIRAQIVERHAELGEAVAEGRPLVTLSSVEMAQAQGTLVVTDREWSRVRDLGREVVSERRYIEAQVDAQQARARVAAFGMVDEQIEALLRSADASLARGEFTLLATSEGVVVRDDFVVGEAIEPGRVLFEITDESTLWVEARLPAREAAGVQLGSPARIKAAGEWIDGYVVQAFHALDENTRTLPVRVQIPNENDELHPGMFVDSFIMAEDSETVLAVPESAVLRDAEGDWRVFLVNGEGGFEPAEVVLERAEAGYAVISGIPPGVRIVVEGGFYLQSEYAKAGFNIHNH